MTLKKVAWVSYTEPGTQPGGSHIVLLCDEAAGVCSITSCSQLACPDLPMSGRKAGKAKRSALCAVTEDVSASRALLTLDSEVW